MLNPLARLALKTRREQRLKKINFTDYGSGLLPGCIARSRYYHLLRGGHWRKLLNFARAEAARFFNCETTGARPYFLSVEPVNFCNLKCPLCTMGRKPSDDILDFGLYSELMGRLGPYVARMELYKRGEPFLHPRIIDMLALASAHGIETTIASNLNVMPEGGATALVKSGLNVLIASLDGTSQETYEKYRLCGKLQSVLDNVSAIAAAKKKLGKKTPFLLLQFVVFKHNESETERAVELARACGADQLMFKPAFIPEGESYRRDWMPENPEFSPDTGHGRDCTCAWPWGGLNVYADGSASVCYRDETCRWTLRELLDGDFRQWNGALLRCSRAAIARREKGEACAGLDGPCPGCENFGGNNFWI